MMTLLSETIVAILNSQHTTEDIIFIGSKDTGHSCTWDEFKILADVKYDSGYGAPEVATDLVIAFKDGTHMWRNEYDGREWWQYIKPFAIPSERKPIKSLIIKPEQIGWRTLEQIQTGE